ncbi:CDP-diacylglycerol--glycerol-3-phosphate 3-phosphatidyltransferase [Magnetospira sp. QH-2]|uniref:CDP-diacylglycerol--glycerol-3-phosphate 3-phosphatidyltransferase n=1 Tax=Magnetospira sp. (strain QH-2) TaxID=1288970 RepID=UPI0003E81672|nr:CDP-diacylglycerol--glycerol-3-phosphate 3-phosphatidyltransferase [Magnetospira sp. QH-2]CCQ74862.1 CDP-diacylglycerol-glycerol-3-phosphate 3-phosphatidyltransferase [Magnetospira sp. QH-2]
MLSTLPNILTVTRILAIPVVVGLFFLPYPYGHWAPFAVFTYAAITDFFDGYLARAWNQQSAFGRMFDPIADKLLVAAVLLMLVGFERLGGLHILPAAVILCREILVSGLREVLAEARVGLPVSLLAKWKTTLQILALGFLMVGTAGPDFGPLSTLQIGIWGLWGAALLTLITGFDYLIAGLRHIREMDAP